MKCILTSLSDQNHRFCWLELRTELTVHSKRHFPFLLCHNPGLLPFSIPLLAQEELWIFPDKQFLGSTAQPPKAFLQKGRVWISPVPLLMLALGHADSKTDQKAMATSPVCHHDCVVSSQGTSAQCHHGDSPTCPQGSCLGQLFPHPHSEMAEQ